MTNSISILVFSDSHGKRAKIEEAIERQIKKPDAIIFLGDGLRDMTDVDVGDVPVIAVRGNCDTMNFFTAEAPDEQCVILGNKRIFLTHGHRFGVKSTLTPLINEAAKKEADIVLYGHTHEGFERELDCDNEYSIKLKNPLYIMNPGSIGSYPYYFGVITIDRSGRVLLSHGSLN